MDLAAVLSTYVGVEQEEIHLGGRRVAGRQAVQLAKEVNVSRLQSEVSQVAKQNAVYFQICFALLIVLFVACCVLVLAFLNQPSRAGAVFGVTGVSFLGVIRQMLKLWKQKLASDLTLALASTLPPSQLLTALETILKQLKS